MKKKVWNTTGKGKCELSLSYVLRRYIQIGHNPVKSGCECCYHCVSCDEILLDDLRTEAGFERKCVEVD